MKKVITVLISVLLLVSLLNVTTFASYGERGESIESLLTVTPRAISGSGTATGTNEEFYIYSPADSWIGHCEITVKGSPSAVVSVGIVGPRGNNVLGNYGGIVVVPVGKTSKFNLDSCYAGNYRVNVISTEVVTVTVTLKDWFA